MTSRRGFLGAGVLGTGVLGAGFLAALGACSSVSAPANPRRALPLPADVARRYTLDAPVREDYLVRLDPAARIYRGRLTVGDEHPEFHLVLPERTPAPFLLCLPILAGGGELMSFVAEDMADRGYAVAWGKRVESALDTHQSVADVETLFRRTVVHNRAVLRWARRQEWHAGGAGLLGISTGGILGGTMLAVEPALDAGVLILAGGDLPDLLMHSSEHRITRWREHRLEADGLSADGFLSVLRRELESDPARTAPFVPTRKVFMVTAGWDTVVPERNRELLWEGFGRPARMHLSVLSHYSAVLGIYPVLSAADRFLTSRMEPARAAPGPR